MRAKHCTTKGNHFHWEPHLLVVRIRSLGAGVPMKRCLYLVCRQGSSLLADVCEQPMQVESVQAATEQSSLTMA
jgi:hypothetical protein